jgi:DHA2 family multidrug resistance protein
VTFKIKEKAQALGIWSASFAAAVVFGPLIGGPLIDTFGWRSVFLVNLPIGLAGILMAMNFIKESTSEIKAGKFDWLGATTLGIFLSAIVLVLDQGSDWGWLSVKSILCYVISVIFMQLFIRVEKKSKEPIVDLSFFQNAAFGMFSRKQLLLFIMGMMGSMYVIPIFVQTYLGLDATETGLLFIPMAFMMLLSASIGGTLTGKVQSKYVIFVSTLFASVGLFFNTFLDPKSSALDVIIPLCVMALGMGFGMAQRTNIIASIIKEEEIGIGSSILALVRNIAGAFGIAIFATILNNRIYSNVLSINSFSTLHSNNPIDIQKFIALVELKAQTNAYTFVFFISFLIVFLGSFTILFLKLKEEKKDAKVIVEG